MSLEELSTITNLKKELELARTELTKRWAKIQDLEGEIESLRKVRDAYKETAIEMIAGMIGFPGAERHLIEKDLDKQVQFILSCNRVMQRHGETFKKLGESGE